MASISAIRDGLKTRFTSITSLANRSHDTWPDQINAPAIMVKPVAMSTKQAMGGHRVRTFEATLLAASLAGGLPRAQDALDAYLDDTGASSVIAALEGDKTLGGIVTTLDVAWSDYGTMEVPPDSGVLYMGAKWEITVWP